MEKAVDGISLEIEEGDFTAVIGTSGSGDNAILLYLKLYKSIA